MVKGLLAAGVFLLSVENAFAACPTLNTSITHRLNLSYCELCGVGTVTVRFSFPGNNNPDLTNLVIAENLGASGLTYIPGTTTFAVNNGPAPAPIDPVVSGPNGSVLTWNLGAYVLPSAQGGGPGNTQFLDVTFQVRRANGVTEEGLFTASRTVSASISYATTNEPPSFTPCTDTENSGNQTLPLRAPNPNIIKLGRNVDANQTPGQYADPVYGHNNDDIIWRIEIENNGLAAMQDVRFDDLMQAGNIVINYACPTEASATAVANNNGVAPGGSPCVAASNTINDFVVTDPFGATGITTNFANGGAGNGFTRNLNGRDVDVTAGGSAFIYLVGKITANGSCISGGRTNTVSDFQFGCEADNNGAGGIPAAGDSATLRTFHGDVNNQLTVQRAITGINTSQPVGSRGYVTLTITNNTGGTVKDIFLQDVLPPEYVVDPTYWATGLVKNLPVRGTPVVGESSIDPLFNSYPGMINRLEWLNPQGLLTFPSQDPLQNTAPRFRLFSSTQHSIYPDQQHMLRHGDVLTVTFPIVLIRQASAPYEPYDRVGNLDVTPEEFPVTVTDPTFQATLTNSLTVDYDTFCPGQGHFTRVFNNTNIPAFPEDLDVSIGGAVFILTDDPNQQLTLPVRLTNNGGHDARNYNLFVTFGATMEVVSAPGGCQVISPLSGTPPQPDPWKVWVNPPSNQIAIPSTATVYRCTAPAVIRPGQTVTYNFNVIKTSDPGRIAIDDLTFRADVVGEITLHDGTPLWFPTPTVRADGQLDRANNYSLDAVWARLIGFNLLKSQVGTCTENNPPPGTPDTLVQIGEECTFHIEAGGWFGFETPGFAFIAVQNIDVVDEIPDGQAYISSTDPLAQSTPLISGVTLNPAPVLPLEEGWFDWRFNVTDRIEVAGEWFRVNATTRILNDALNSRTAPNFHASDSDNILNSTFDATFQNKNTGATEQFALGPTTVGYPNEPIRRFDLTVTEPLLQVVKEVCNETLYGVGPACSNWTTLAADGDAFNSYIYRLTVTNEAASAGVTRAPAYDVVVTDVLDSSDLALVLPFASDGLNNDGDAATDEPGAGSEGSINDNNVRNGIPAEITFSFTHSTALQRIDPGQSVQLYYRVDFDDDAAPLQTFTNTANTTYDSLAGPTGNQTVEPRPNGEIGGARVYQAPPASASVRIIPVLTQPKRITRLSNTPVGGAPQPVSIGEEVEYELVTSIPVALLRNFVIRDELPVGIRCAQAPDVDLGPSGPHAAAGFQPGGVIRPTCTDNLVEWNFGDQRVTKGTTNNRYDFAIRFIARVENTANTNDGDVISNGGAATSVTARYIDEANNLIELTFGQVDILVREPRIDLTKAFAVANADAGDVLTITVTATNSGTATAYQLRVLDDLTGKKLTFLGNLGGADPPDNVDTTTLGANRPIFSWNPANPKFAIAPGEIRSFTFEVRVDTAVQPLEILDDTLQARWTSLPSQNTALNTGGAIGADGSATGMRNGTLPNSSAPINDYETTATHAFSVPAVAMTKTDLSPSTVPTIGAHKNFQIEIRLPEGTTNNLIVSDNLAATGLSYVLANNASFDITYTFDGIATINGQAPSEAALVSFPADNTSGIITWNIGTVVTATEDDTVSNALNPVIRINYYARVNNDLVTDAGDTLQNGVVLNHTHGETGAPVTLNASTPVVTVVEPRLTLSKTLANVTPGKLPTDPPVPGDILEYRLIAANTGNATAFDINLVDNLPPGLVLYSGFTPTATINLNPVTGFVSAPAGAPAGPLVWGRGNGDGSLDLPAGQTLVLTYQAEVQAIIDPNGLIENGVLADWTSLDDVSPYERTGAGCPTITPPDDYCVGPVVATTNGITPVLEFRKTVFDAITGQPAATARPGDTLRYRVQVRNVSAAPVNNFSIVDDLDRLNDPARFAAGSLALTAFPATADITNTNPNGGIRGTGLVDVRNLSVGIAGSGNDTVAIEFTVRLAPVIPNGTVVLNQAQLIVVGIEIAVSDDPNVNGPDDPSVSGDEDPTRTVISSAPAFLMQKTLQDLTGDPNVLDAGDTLRFTITAQNNGTENAINAVLRDLVPANSTYVPGSTTLNGTAVADPGGTPPLQNGLSVNSPGDPAGVMRADPSGGAGNVVTVTFDVQVRSDVLNGTILCNQGFLNGSGESSGAFPEKASDNPATALLDDPTCKIVGNLPLLTAQKAVQLVGDANLNGFVDPNDTLRYTITIVNSGAIPATGVVLTDPVPANTTYVPNSVLLDGNPVAGVSPPVLQIPIGTLAPGGTAVVTFDVQVNTGVLPGTLISNQGSVASNELPTVLTNVVVTVVGNAQQLVISKEVFVVGGGPALAGGQLEYLVRVTNVSAVAASNVVITDDLNPLIGQLSYVAGSATLNASINGVSFGGGVIRAEYSLTYGALPPGASAILRFRADIDAGLAIGTRITNTAQVTWNTPTQSASASVSIDIGGIPGSAILNGRAWHDANFNNVLDGSEQLLAGWAVELYRNGTLIATVSTAADGSYRFSGLAPNDITGDQYEIRFRAPGAGPNTALLGLADSPFTNGLQRISAIVAGSGSNLQNLNLPIDPNGVVYDSVGRTPIAGATLTLLQASTRTALSPNCFDDQAQQGQVTLASGYYKFDLKFGDPSCPANTPTGIEYLIEVVPPANFNATPSQIIPPAATVLAVPTCEFGPNDAIPSTDFCEVQSSEFAPPTSVPPRSAGTTYYLNLSLSNGTVPQDSQVFNNHIPIDPELAAAIAITKTTPMVNVTRAALVPYTITVRNTLAGTLQDLAIVDTPPPGFKYVAGSGRFDGNPLEPIINGRQLRWEGLTLVPTETHTIKLLLVVSSGVAEGEYTNSAQVVDTLTGGNASGVATATVRVVADPTFDCTDIIGKVFDDANLNGLQDRGEKGLGGVRVVSARGLLATTDQYGRFHISCAVLPNQDRGSNFILKVDDRTLPSGYRVTTDNPLVLRATRGKAIKFNFGAALHRIVRIDVAEGAFEPDSTKIRPQWATRLGVLVDELRKAPAILRISYLADVEGQAIVRARLDAVKREVEKRWTKLNYRLTIETEIYWRRGGPPAKKGISARAGAGLMGLLKGHAVGGAVERHLEPDEPRSEWTHGEETEKQGDHVEVHQVPVAEAKTIKLQNVVPAIRFGSGEAEIPEGYTALLRNVLKGMKDRANVRLHLVGHTDNVRLVGEAKTTYVDNLGLSRERAGTVAEYFQQALGLPPESVSYEGVGDTQPVADNETDEGRTRNRRVEVEVWYDEISDKLVDKEVVVSEKLNRVKVCRVETVCKLRYKEGHSKRARIKNLIAPLHFDDETASIPGEFLQQLRQALANLKGKDNVAVKFIGYTDNVPLTGRVERIYGNHEGLSKARARRAALAVQDALKLPTSALEVEGKGAAMPLASNDTDKGRALNRRIEVEFWHDDALQELPDEPQICPEAAGAETVTRVYDPGSGGIKPILYEHGEPVIPAEYTQRLREVMDEIRDKAHVRLRFIGYTDNQRLERRTAMLYGDDIGLSTARARRAAEAVKAQLGLSDRQVEFEGRGYVQSNDVVNTGFIESDTARVEVQVVYDELAALDDESLEITRLTREVNTKDPFALNLMRITVDGQPLHDPGKSMSDVGRCTDVAFGKANIEFKFDNLEFKPRLNVTAYPNVVRYRDDPATEYPENRMLFRTYSNYAAFIEKAEVRIFESTQSERDAPLAVVDVSQDGYAEWQASFDDYQAPGRELKYVLRVYDKDGRFDETKAQPIRLVDAVQAGARDEGAQEELLVGYGETRIAVENIRKKGGAIKVYGDSVPKGHSVWVAGRAVPVDKEGRFAAETLLPAGTHTVEVAVLDRAGNGESFLRDLKLKKNDWFYVAIADITATRDNTSGPANIVTGDETHYENDLNVDGRLAFYAKGKFGDGWRLTASADTLEGPVEDMFSNFLDKSPGALFRRIDPDYHYPTYGDDSSVEEDAPTLGKAYARLSKNESYGLWGNFKVGYTDNDLAHVDRGLYGANVHYQSLATTSFGEQRFVVDGFAAEPGTVAARDEFLGTGGSLYFLRHQDILVGGERARVEIRDKDSGLVLAVKNLTPVLDYDIDYIQGRIVLTQPLSATASDNMLVASDSLSGHPVFLVVRYEFTPGFDDLDTLSVGGRSHYWFNDHVKLGITSNRNEESGTESSLHAADLTLRKTAESWVKLQRSTTDGLGTPTLDSRDGGFSFGAVDPFASANVSADAYRLDGSIGFGDFFSGGKGRLTLYKQSLGAGYSAPGLTAPTDTDQYGGTLQMPVGAKVNLTAKMDKRVRELGLETSASEVDVGYQLNEHWNVSSGVRRDNRKDRSAIVPLTQEQGDRTDVAARATYDSKGKWSVYGFVQDTVDKSGNREDNGRVGSGASLRVTDRLKLSGEVSSGDLGPAGKLGMEYLYSDRTNVYLNYVVENETSDNGIRAKKGNMVSGFRSRFSDSASVYLEERYTHGDVPTGLTHSTGVDLAPTDRWTLGARVDFGTLRDFETGAETERNALAFHASYGFKALNFGTAFEYRMDETENPDTTVSDRKTWLFKNSLKWQMSPSSRLIGKLNWSDSESSQGQFFDGKYTEAVLGYGYRPVTHDRFNMLLKYTYFYNLPTAGQVGGTTSTAADFIQKSHILSFDTMYDIDHEWSIGGKYAYRLGQLSTDRVNPEFFDSRAQLYIVRADWRFKREWSALIETRVLDLPDAEDRRSGGLFTLYRHLNEHFKVGIGYNFTDFSDDLTDLDYDSKGLFINLIGKM